MTKLTVYYQAKQFRPDNWKSSKGDTFSADVSLDPDTFKVSTKFKNKNDFIFNENEVC